MSKTVGIRNYQSSKQQHGKHQHDKVLQISKLQALIGTAKYQKKNDEKKCWYKKSSKQQQPSHKHRHHKNMQTSAWQVSQNETSV
jgi:hypothetical protein